MDIRKVKKLIEMLEDSDVAEIEIHEGEESVRISRYSSVAPAVATPVAVAAPPTTIVTPSPAAAPSVADSGAAVDTHSNDNVITSPMVGTFYRAASPTSKPFVEEGAEVKEGDTLCIIEAMKILNQITADNAGVIKKVLVENGAPVEYGQPLFALA